MCVHQCRCVHMHIGAASPCPPGLSHGGPDRASTSSACGGWGSRLCTNGCSHLPGPAPVLPQFPFLHTDHLGTPCCRRPLGRSPAACEVGGDPRPRESRPPSPGDTQGTAPTLCAGARGGKCMSSRCFSPLWYPASPRDGWDQGGGLGGVALVPWDPSSRVCAPPEPCWLGHRGRRRAVLAGSEG